MFHPRLFLSYSRADKALVESLSLSLSARGFRVFLDTSEMEPGENFVKRLRAEIDRSSGFVAVITSSYGASRWAQAEMYHAIAAGKPVIPLLAADGAVTLDAPLQRLLQDIHYVDYRANAVGDDFAAALARARRRYLADVTRRSLPLVVAVAAIGLASWWIVENLNDNQRKRQRDSLLQEVEVPVVLPADRIAAMATTLPGDKLLRAQLLLAANDRQKADAARFNAMALASKLGEARGTERWYIKDLKLDRASIEGWTLSNVSFLGGGWSGVDIANSVFANAFFAEKGGFQVSGSKFRNVEFAGGAFEAINATDVEFVNSKFRGMVIDTTNFGLVRFRGETREVEGQLVITPQYALVEKSVIVSKRKPPESGVLSLATPGSDVLFTDVLFVDCRLDGYFSPDWFRNVTFERCDLPASLTPESLARGGNRISR